jgi:hypothetical protein
MLGPPVFVIVTVELDGAHGELEIVHINTFVPTPNPVIPDVGDEGDVIVPVPLISVQRPAPIVGMFPANVAVVPQIV